MRVVMPLKGRAEAMEASSLKRLPALKRQLTPMVRVVMPQLFCHGTCFRPCHIYTHTHIHTY